MPTTEKLKWDFRQAVQGYDQVFQWYSSLPKIFRSFTIFKSNEEKDFIASLKKGRNYEGLVDGELKCFIHGETKNEYIIEGHLFCEPHCDLDFICSTVTYAKNTALKDYKYVTTQVIKKHPILHDVMKRAGFADTGLRSYSHVYRNSLLEVVHYIAWRNYEK